MHEQKVLQRATLFTYLKYLQHCSRTVSSLLYMRATMHYYISVLIRIIHRTMIFDFLYLNALFRRIYSLNFAQS